MKRMLDLMLALAGFLIAAIAHARMRLAASSHPISRRDPLGSWSNSVPPPSDAASVLTRGNSHRFGTGMPGAVAAGQA
jgi:hypothetical protein